MSLINIQNLTFAYDGSYDNVFENVTYIPMSLKEYPLYKNWEYSEKNIGSMDAVYFYDFESDGIEKLTVNNIDDSYELRFQSGELLGTVYEYPNDDGNGKYGVLIEE